MHDAANTKTASGELSRMATELERLVAQFKYDSSQGTAPATRSEAGLGIPFPARAA